MKLRTKIMVAGTVGAAAGIVLAVRAVKRATKRVLNRKMRKILREAVMMRAEDYMPKSKLGTSLFRKRIEKLTDRQLVTLCALVQVGYFIKASGIDLSHPTKEQVERAINKFYVEERLAPQDRPGLLGVLDSSDTCDALRAAFGVLAEV